MRKLPAAELVIYTLAVARITGLVTTDVITEPVRERIRAAWAGRPGYDHVAYLLGDAEHDGCNWCASIWVAAAAAPAVWRWGARPALLVPALGLAMSQVTGMIGRVGR